MSAPILQAAGVARNDFSSRLKEFPAKTEFDRFVENIDNYDVGLSDAGDNFVVVFKLRKKKGTVVMGGGAIYTVRKKDLMIVNFAGQELVGWVGSIDPAFAASGWVDGANPAYGTQ